MRVGVLSTMCRCVGVWEGEWASAQSPCMHPCAVLSAAMCWAELFCLLIVCSWESCLHIASWSFWGGESIYPLVGDVCRVLSELTCEESGVGISPEF